MQCPSNSDSGMTYYLRLPIASLAKSNRSIEFYVRKSFGIQKSKSTHRRLLINTDTTVGKMDRLQSTIFLQICDRSHHQNRSYIFSSVALVSMYLLSIWTFLCAYSLNISNPSTAWYFSMTEHR